MDPSFARLASLAALVLSAACGGGSEDDRSAVRAALANDSRAVLPTGETVSGAVNDFYLSDSFDRLLWVDGDDLTSAGEDLEEALAKARDEGVEAAIEMSTLDGADPAIRELALSQAFVSTARGLNVGDIDQDSVGEGEPMPDTTRGRDLLDRVSRGASPTALLDSIRPDLPWYRQTVEALAALREVEASGGWPRVKVPADSLVEPGDSGSVVRSLRARLEAGVDRAERELASRAGPDIYDDALEEAVRSFQRRHGIAVDGTVGPSTVAALNTPVEERIDQVYLSLQRMRWLPNRLPERVILVNVAGFEMQVIEEGESVLEMNVVVGKPDWPTTLFSDTLSHIVFNPYWHVPESIAEAELLPQILEDPGFLAANRLEVVPADDPYGEAVDPEEVDFATFEGYALRESPGPENALGRMKFMFPNEHNIYLHDTPADHLFDINARAFSHGCVRLEYPRELARYLFENAIDRPVEDLDSILDRSERTQVDLAEPIPIHLVYLTTWADENGRLYFHPDIYARNELFHRILETQ